MFNIFKKVKNKGNTPKQDYNLSYDNLAIPEIHKGDSDDEDVDISSDIIYQAIIDSLHSIMDAIKVILERTPPELAADIIKDGVYFTGGTSQINNLEKYIKDETNLNVNIVEHPAESVVRGLMGVVSNPEFAKVAYTPTEKNFD